MKVEKFKLKAEMYPHTFLFWFSDSFREDYKQAFNWAERSGIVGSDDFFEEPQESSAMFIDRFTYGSIIVGQRPVDAFGYAMLVHEVAHGVFNAGQQLGFGLRRESEEFYCYMMQFLSHQLFRRLWK